MQNKRNLQANCGNCPLMWEGQENFMHGVDSIIQVPATKCTKDFKYVNKNQFCNSHPEFWESQPAGIKRDAIQG